MPDGVLFIINVFILTTMWLTLAYQFQKHTNRLKKEGWPFWPRCHYNRWHGFHWLPDYGKIGGLNYELNFLWWKFIWSKRKKKRMKTPSGTIINP